jgi:anti-anti-sigma regulatory factor
MSFDPRGRQDDMAIPTGGTCCLAVRGPLERRDLPGLRARACQLLADTRPASVLCDVSAVTADAVAVEALAGLQLAAVRRGARISLVGTRPELRGLLRLVGLDDVLPDAP